MQCYGFVRESSKQFLIYGDQLQRSVRFDLKLAAP
jgi:hypothetical protein